MHVSHKFTSVFPASTSCQWTCGFLHITKNGRNGRKGSHLLPFLASDSLASFGSEVALNTIWHPAQVNAHSLF
jgi:hypothetical protein